MIPKQRSDSQRCRIERGRDACRDKSHRKFYVQKRTGEDTDLPEYRRIKTKHVGLK